MLTAGPERFDPCVAFPSVMLSVLLILFSECSSLIDLGCSECTLVVSVASMLCLWFVFGLSLMCLWCVSGLSLVCLWFVSGLSLVCLWLFSLRRIRGVLKASWSRIESYSRLCESYLSIFRVVPVFSPMEQRKRSSLKTLCRAPSGALTIPTCGSSV
jgi:hypothetical protein